MKTSKQTVPSADNTRLQLFFRQYCHTLFCLYCFTGQLIQTRCVLQGLHRTIFSPTAQCGSSISDAVSPLNILGYLLTCRNSSHGFERSDFRGIFSSKILEMSKRQSFTPVLSLQGFNMQIQMSTQGLGMYNFSNCQFIDNQDSFLPCVNYELCVKLNIFLAIY